MSAPPFVVGQWVRGEAFYGRRREIAEILAASAGLVWLAGLRRMGKTSLLREVERQAPADTLPVFWDLQGVEDGAELALSFVDALLDAEEAVEQRGLSVAEAGGQGGGSPDLETITGLLAAALRRHRLGLLLLIDEADALAGLGSAAAAAGAALRSIPGIRVVIATSPAFAASPLAGWPPLQPGEPKPRLLGALAAAEAARLLCQEHLVPTARPSFNAATVERACRLAGGHPMLLQLLGRRAHQLGDLDRACRQVEAERTVDHLLAVDWDLLTDGERRVLGQAAAGPFRAPRERLGRLPDLGLLAATADGGWELAHAFLAGWLRRRGT